MLPVSIGADVHPRARLTRYGAHHARRGGPSVTRHIAGSKSVKGYKLAACNPKGPAAYIIPALSEAEFIASNNRCKRCEAILEKRRAINRKA